MITGTIVNPETRATDVIIMTRVVIKANIGEVDNMKGMVAKDEDIVTGVGGKGNIMILIKTAEDP